MTLSICELDLSLTNFTYSDSNVIQFAGDLVVEFTHR